MIKLTDDREAALDAAFLALRERMPGASRDALANAMADYRVRAIVTGGEAIGAFFTKGPEVHVAVVPRHHRRWLTRSLLREGLQPIIRKYGYATCSVMADNDRGDRFVRRLGFVPTRDDGRMTHYEVTA